MKERPILFSAPMVLAILDGRKTQTRRAVSLKLLFGEGAYVNNCPYGKPGDRLWVRETFTQMDINHCACYEPCGKCVVGKYAYKADGKFNEIIDKWKPSIHMPRSASRILLEVTNVRIERLQDINEEDAIAEGCIKFPFEDDHAYTFRADDKTGHATHTGAYRNLWDSINSPGSWGLNPLVWVVEFKKINE